MLKLLKKETHTPQTERIYKVPLCIQDTIPIYRIAENGIFELEKPTSGSKKGIHQFDRMYLFEDINFSTQDEEEKEDTCSKFETLLRSMNVSYKIIVSNHYADNNKLREEILQKAVSKEMEPLAKEYHKMIGERLEEGPISIFYPSAPCFFLQSFGQNTVNSHQPSDRSHHPQSSLYL